LLRLEGVVGSRSELAAKVAVEHDVSWTGDFHQRDGSVYKADTNCIDFFNVTAVIPPEVLGNYSKTWIAVVNSAG
jgi:hypothetical protein